MKTIKAYHFTGKALRDGQPIPPIGKWLRHEGPIVPCRHGLHASEHPFDMLQYASGPYLHMVELRGEIQTHGDPVDKLVARERRILATIDATELLREAARSWALDVAHLWDAPEIVLHFLATGDETLRAAAWDAAWDAVRAAARDAAWDAARAAAREAAWEAARADAGVRAAAAARSAAWAKSEAAAGVAFEAAARSVASAADADAARGRQRMEFLHAVEAEFIIQGLVNSKGGLRMKKRKINK